MCVTELVLTNGNDSVAQTALRQLSDRADGGAETRKPRTPTKTSTLIITSVQRVSSPDSETDGAT